MAKNISQMANICDTGAVVKEESEVGDEYHIQDTFTIGITLLNTYSSCCVWKRYYLPSSDIAANAT